MSHETIIHQAHTATHAQLSEAARRIKLAEGDRLTVRGGRGPYRHGAWVVLVTSRGAAGSAMRLQVGRELLAHLQASGVEVG